MKTTLYFALDNGLLADLNNACDRANISLFNDRLFKTVSKARPTIGGFLVDINFSCNDKEGLGLVVESFIIGFIEAALSVKDSENLYDFYYSYKQSQILKWDHQVNRVNGIIY